MMVPMAKKIVYEMQRQNGDCPENNHFSASTEIVDII